MSGKEAMRQMIEILQNMREEGDSDMRTAIWHAENLLSEIEGD